MRTHKFGEANSFVLEFGTAGGAVHRETSSEQTLKIRPLNSESVFEIKATAIEKPCHKVESICPSIFTKYAHLDAFKGKIQIVGGVVDILIGRDYAPIIHAASLIQADTDPMLHPSVAVTPLGPYIFGGLTNYVKPSSIRVNHIAKVEHIDPSELTDIRKFFESELIGVKPSSLCVCSDNEVQESAFIKHVKETTELVGDRVCVSMPWKTGYPDKLENNYCQAFALMEKPEKELIANGKLEAYNEEIMYLDRRGVVRHLTPDEVLDAQTEKAWYLDHRIVERPDKTSTKARVVWNSARPYKGQSLNDGLHKGPNYTNSMFKCAMSLREEEVAFSGDVGKMFNNILMHLKDQPFHRFLWRNGDSSVLVPVIRQWLRVLFGDSPSPDLAGYAVKMLADMFSESHPAGALVLRDQTYVDDVGGSNSSFEEARDTISQVDKILNSRSFAIKHWNSNRTELDQNPDEVEVDLLGYRWNKREDTLSL